MSFIYDGKKFVAENTLSILMLILVMIKFVVESVITQCPFCFLENELLKDQKPRRVILLNKGEKSSNSSNTKLN